MFSVGEPRTVEEMMTKYAGVMARLYAPVIRVRTPPPPVQPVQPEPPAPVEASPVAEAPKEPSRPWDHWTPEQWDEFVDQLDAHRKARGTRETTFAPVDLRVILVSDLIRKVSLITDIPVVDILSDRRHGPKIHARQITVWVALRFTVRSQPEIARELKRDHTTVLHHRRQIEKVVAQIGHPAEESPEAWIRHLWWHFSKSHPRPQSLSSGDPA